LRFLVDDPPVEFQDRVAGLVREDVAETVGDFVLRRRDGVFAYQLAVVVDDLAMGVTEVVRGRDLLDSTARQILLIRALGGRPPEYAHVPLVVNGAGEKLSKRDAAVHVDALLAAGVTADAIVGWLAWALGQQDAPHPSTAAAVAARWDWQRVAPAPVVAPSFQTL
jgi:glutamyl-tRNA synthetase